MEEKAKEIEKEFEEDIKEVEEEMDTQKPKVTDEEESEETQRIKSWLGQIKSRK